MMRARRTWCWSDLASRRMWLTPFSIVGRFGREQLATQPIEGLVAPAHRWREHDELETIPSLATTRVWRLEGRVGRGRELFAVALPSGGGSAPKGLTRRDATFPRFDQSMCRNLARRGAERNGENHSDQNWMGTQAIR